MKRQTLRLTVSLLTLCATVAACTGSPRSHTPTTPLRLSITPTTTAGTVEVRRKDTWHKAAQGSTSNDVTMVRTQGRGAILSLGDKTAPAATLWLRGSSSARLSQDQEGHLYVTVIDGHARLRVRDPSLVAYAGTNGRLIDVSGRDVLLKEPRGSETTMSLTGKRPQQADWTLGLEIENEPAGIGRIETRSSNGTTELLQLNSVSVDVTIHGDLAVTRVTHVFFNPSDSQLEGTFRFPVPDGAMIQGLAMEIDGRLMEGEIVEKEKARKTYESIVDSMQDPALLEWEEGHWFKLRVFPIEAQSTKRVVLTYATPLSRGISGFEYVYLVSAPEGQNSIGRFKLQLDGKTIEDTRLFSSGKEIVVDVSNVPEVMREVVGDHVYTAVRIKPDWGNRPPVIEDSERKLLLLFDTSRSSLEGRALALDTLQMVLAELDESDLFMVATVDLTVREHKPNFVTATNASIKEAMDFVRGIDADGASDLSAALAFAGNSGASEVVYIGDGTPTWGETDGTAIKQLADKHLAKTPVYAAIIGKGVDMDLWRELTGRLSGRAARPRSPLSARQFAFFVGHAHEIARVDRIKAIVGDEATAFPRQETTLFDGDELRVITRHEKSKQPAELVVTGRQNGEDKRRTIRLANAKPVRFLGQRWAAKQMAVLTGEGGHKEEIVQLSKDFGILSRHTSLLVLESEEAYRQHQIERRRGPQQLVQNSAADPRVTGGDLDSLSRNRPSLGPDHVQPGDPEIRIPAPADALSVVVDFPFGETKIAIYDDEIGAWLVRFLIDKETPDGKYHVSVRITHADGQVQTLRLPYQVDTVPPAMRISLRPTGRGSFVLVATVDVPEGQQSDTRRVEVMLPDGRLIRMKQQAPDQYRVVWRPRTTLSVASMVRVVATDVALNQSIIEVSIPMRTEATVQ